MKNFSGRVIYKEIRQEIYIKIISILIRDTEFNIRRDLALIVYNQNLEAN